MCLEALCPPKIRTQTKRVPKLKAELGRTNDWYLFSQNSIFSLSIMYMFDLYVCECVYCKNSAPISLYTTQSLAKDLLIINFGRTFFAFYFNFQIARSALTNRWYTSIYGLSERNGYPIHWIWLQANTLHTALVICTKENSFATEKKYEILLFAYSTITQPAAYDKDECKWNEVGRGVLCVRNCIRVVCVLNVSDSSNFGTQFVERVGRLDSKYEYTHSNWILLPLYDGYLNLMIL